MAVSLSGCALPPAISIASLVLDIGSFAISGKTVTDHGISLVAQEDCAMIKVLEGQLCEAYPEYDDVSVATLEPLPAGEPELATLERGDRGPAGPLSDLEYIAAETQQLAELFPQGPGNGEAFRDAAADRRETLPEPAPRPQFAAVPDNASSLLGVSGYLSDSARPNAFQ